MNQRLERLDGLAPILHKPVLRLIEQCNIKLNRKLLVVSGWRSVQEQMLNYQKGRIVNRETGEWEVFDTLLVVTNAKPGLTPHNVITRDGGRASLAVDLIPLNTDGTADWNAAMPFWTALYELAWQCGLDPLGDRVGAYLKNDLGHFEEPGWKWKLDGLGLILPASGGIVAI